MKLCLIICLLFFICITKDFGPKIDATSMSCKASSGNCNGAISGDLHNQWYTSRQQAGAWIEIDFDDTYQISKLLMMHRPEGARTEMFKGLKLEFSTGSSVDKTLSNEQGQVWNEVDLPQKPITTFIKITATSTHEHNGHANAGLREIVIFGGSPPGNIFISLQNT